MRGAGFGERLISWATGTIVGVGLSIAIALAMVLAVLSFAMQDRQKAMETTASTAIVGGEYLGAGIGLVPTFVKSAAVGLSGMMGIAAQQEDKSGIFTENKKGEVTVKR